MIYIQFELRSNFMYDITAAQMFPQAGEIIFNF